MPTKVSPCHAEMVKLLLANIPCKHSLSSTGRRSPKVLAFNTSRNWLTLTEAFILYSIGGDIYSARWRLIKALLSNLARNSLVTTRDTNKPNIAAMTNVQLSPPKIKNIRATNAPTISAGITAPISGNIGNALSRLIALIAASISLNCCSRGK